MRNGTSSVVTYQWPLIKAQLAKGTVCATGSPFNYRYQLRVKSTPATLYFTFWDFAKCIESGQFLGAEDAAWDQFGLELENRGISAIPCVGVGVSVWNHHPMLVRTERDSALTLDALNRALRAKPQSVRRDLQANGIYGYAAMACNQSKWLIFGLPIGHTVRERLARLPPSWACAAWFGPVAVPFFQDIPGEHLYHTVLLRDSAISVMTENGVLRFFQQDRALVEGQPVSQGALAKFKSVYSYFPRGRIVHHLHPADASLTWANNLRKCIQSTGYAAEVRIVPSAKLQFPGIAGDASLQDMFPGGAPWNGL